MKKVKLIFASLFLLFSMASVKSQSAVLILTNENNHKEYIIENGDNILLDIHNKKGKLKEKEEVEVLFIDQEKLHVLPAKKRFGEQAIAINELKHIWIKTTGTRAAGCFLFTLNLFSGTSNAPIVYKKIKLNKPHWQIKVKDKRR